MGDGKEGAMEVDDPAGRTDELVIELDGLHFTYCGPDGLPQQGCEPLFQGLSWKVEKGSRVLLIGSNGAGKTTVMKIMAGKHMVDRDQCKILGESPFHATDLTSSGRLSYIGGTWQRDIAFAGYNIPLQGDFSALKMIDGIQGVDQARKERVIKVLDIDPEWRMHTVSEGQRRRVQLCIGLLKEYEVLFLDEVTVDLDVLGRADLMNFLKEECEQRKCTIIYATHIFDGLEPWPTHLAFFAGGEMKVNKPSSEFPELREGRLVNLVAEWLRDHERDEEARPNKAKKEEFRYLVNNGWSSGRSNASIKLSSNAVWRC
ncbi:P-loop-containing nucleoside triphosphate hydrolase [Chloropicon primus]|uniref:P-loop-containing nucleoside triphosphate hydrolase n=1 Tax=Chloropicon primus TaxID=1764295 RepID=A0A5B8MBV7_9CHLO|nr:P-loop-containing nucleoside triphosphate hydrolase [Chloropicon primus]UPQ97133.1 P-loop-containing nucleoside triphosphate hydrolase [Chloropicon primus]|eukprot:QDZ17918.1 P-loop-containing nucleoside triphosphate hydrolase [Chloropicon primus]